MVTWRLSQVIESLGDEGVGSMLTAVAVGRGEGVAGLAVFDVRSSEAHPVKRINPTARIVGIVFIKALEIHPI